MKRKVFSINFYISTEEGIFAKVEIKSEDKKDFEEVFRVDLAKIFKSEEFENEVNTISVLIEKEISKQINVQ